MQNAYQKRGMLVVDAEIPAYSVEAIDFFDLKPNYFRVQNKGNNKVYCGISKVPTDETYDFYCKGESFSMYAEPHGTGYLNIYNPSGSPVKVRVLGFAAAFDPLALAFSQIEIDLSDLEIKSEGIISEFKTSLPAGSNKIGKFDVANWPTDYAKAANQRDYTTAITELVENQKYFDFYGNMEFMSGSGLNGDIAISGGGKVYIAMLTNDGNTDITVNIVNNNGYSTNMVLKPGETIQDFKALVNSMKISGNGYAYRAAIAYP